MTYALETCHLSKSIDGRFYPGSWRRNDATQIHYFAGVLLIANHEIQLLF